MRSRATLMGLSMLLGVQLMPDYWVKQGDYIVPKIENASRQQTGQGGGWGGASGAQRDTEHFRGYFGTPWGTMNDALPYEWAKNFWLCGAPPISLAGTGLYWQNRPITFCIF